MLGRLFSRAQAPSQIPSAPPKLAPPPAAAPAAIEHEEEATERHTHFPTFAEVPKFVSVMAAPLVRLSAAEKETLVVIEQVGRVVLMLMADDGAAPESVVESVRGSLLSNRYAVNIGTAPRSVIASIYSGWQQADLTRGTSVNKYMQSFHEWITYAVENRATDIHLERRGSTGFVRMRIDGEVEPLRNENKGVYPGDYIERCMSTLYNNEQQRKSGSGSMFEPDKNLYCMVPYSEIAGHTLKLRYQSVTGNEGPKCVLRLLHVDEDAPTLTFEQLGYAPSHIDLWQQGMNTPSGAILIAGVTGSGKSTTQKSFLELNPSAPYMGIYTIEDPVEYPIKYAHQIPIQRDISDPVGSARKYGEAVSTLMRADPDAGMLGEIRDGPSATAMQQLTETGHMGLGTVHAHLLSGIVPRLSNREIGMSRDVITGPNMLTLAVYQALVPKLCPQCALSTEQLLRDQPDIAAVVSNLRELGMPLELFRWKNPRGCECCKQRGTVGQTVVAEMLMPTPEWLKATREGDDPGAVEAYRGMSDGDLLSPDMTGKTVFEHCLWKAAQGLVDARQCQRFDNFRRFVARHKQARKVMR